ncbi:hypothetical protein GCM10009765_63140 [Fodinicola feengrottensis]|uniref:Uncharacterized protein n=1 Tax=Fodinicola feengrottensis TaxID=435914 RepID=A0ABP4UM65_9ACTN
MEPQGRTGIDGWGGLGTGVGRGSFSPSAGKQTSITFPGVVQDLSLGSTVTSATPVTIADWAICESNEWLTKR